MYKNLVITHQTGRNVLPQKEKKTNARQCQCLTKRKSGHDSFLGGKFRRWLFFTCQESSPHWETYIIIACSLHEMSV